jgi:cytochrome c
MNPAIATPRLVAVIATIALSPIAGAQPLDAGRKAFQECIACHSTEKGVNGVGPSLAGIVGSKAGDVEGFRFSGPMRRSGIVWTSESLNRFLADPQAVVPGTRMPYSGMADAADRAALIQYLGSLK